MTDAPKKQPTDWDAIEKLYRANILSIREIAAHHGVSDTAIRKHAKKHGWTQDLREEINSKVRTELVRTEVRTANPELEARTKQEIVDHAAAMVVQVVRDHRISIKTGKELVDTLMQQLRDAVGHRAMLEVLIEEMTKLDDSPKRYDMLMKAVSIPEQLKAVVNASNALKNYIQLERQAFNIGDEAEEKTDLFDEMLTRIRSAGSRLPIKPNTPGE